MNAKDAFGFYIRKYLMSTRRSHSGSQDASAVRHRLTHQGICCSMAPTGWYCPHYRRPESGGLCPTLHDYWRPGRFEGPLWSQEANLGQKPSSRATLLGRPLSHVVSSFHLYVVYKGLHLFYPRRTYELSLYMPWYPLQAHGCWAGPSLRLPLKLW